ncbi:MAG: metal ABC transporter substrate-binding protein [Planctomycetota bacterium]
MRHLPLLFVLGVLACGQDSAPTAAGESPDGVYAVNYPLQYFAQRIAGEHLEVRFLAPPEVDPAFWIPRDDDVAALQTAELILLNGATYAKWLDLVTVPKQRAVVTSAAFEDALLELPITTTHSHGQSGTHSHAGIDFNTWVDPVLARKQAAAVLEALIELRPAHANDFEANAAALDDELATLDAAFRELSAATDDLRLLASHPVYGYLAARYGWRVQALLWEPEAMPDEDEWEALGSILKLHPARWMLYEDTPAPEIAKRLREDFEIEPVVLRPCGNRPASGDYLDEMRAGLERLRPVFQP